MGQIPIDNSAVNRRRGRVERAVCVSIVAGRAGDAADRRWAAAETLARSIGAALDTAGARGDPYAVAQLSPRLLAVLQELKLTPLTAELAADPLADLLADIEQE